MDLIEYKQPHVTYCDAPTISISPSGLIKFNKFACERLNIKTGDRISLFQDRKLPLDWYFRIGSEGAIVRPATNNNGCVCNFSQPAKIMLQACKVPRMTVRIASEPVDGYYAILTRSLNNSAFNNKP